MKNLAWAALVVALLNLTAAGLFVWAVLDGGRSSQLVPAAFHLAAAVIWVAVARVYRKPETV